jgi:acetyl-CoA carboxylase biotin carboxyl carrier protein
MNLKQLEKIMQLMEQYDMHKITITDAETNIKLARNCAAAYGLLAGDEPRSLARTEMPVGAVSAQAAAGAASTLATSGTAEKSLAPAKSSTAKEIKSPFVGTYYGAPSPGADSFIHVGKRVKKGEVLCIIEAMKLMNEIEAERDGVIVDILIANEEPVEYDQPLFLFE